jgi:hypothetical protein
VIGYSPTGVFEPRFPPEQYSPWAPESCGFALANFGGGSGLGSQNGLSATNRAIFFPVWIARPFNFRRGFWFNGTAVTGTVCVGLYNTSGALLARTASTTQTGTSVLQDAAVAADGAGNVITNYLAAPGGYYMGFSGSTGSTTQTFFGITLALGQFSRALGSRMISTASHPLPNSASAWVGSTETLIPYFGVANRAAVA